MADTNTTLAQLRQTIDDLYQKLSTLTKGTAEYTAANRQLQEATAQLNAENSKLSASSQNITGVYNDVAKSTNDISRGFSSLSKSTGLLTEQNSKLSSVISSFNSFKGLTNGIASLSKGVTGANGTFKALFATLKANPFGALLGVVGAITAAFSLFSSSGKDAVDTTELLNRSNEELAKTLAASAAELEYEVRILEAYGGSLEDIYNLRRRGIEQQIAELQLVTAQFDQYFSRAYETAKAYNDLIGIAIPDALQALYDANQNNLSLIDGLNSQLTKLEQDYTVNSIRAARQRSETAATEAKRAADAQLRELERLEKEQQKARERELDYQQKYTQAVAKLEDERAAAAAKAAGNIVGYNTILIDANNQEIERLTARNELESISFEERYNNQVRLHELYTEQTKLNAEIAEVNRKREDELSKQLIAGINEEVKTEAYAVNQRIALEKAVQKAKKQTQDVTVAALQTATKVAGEETAAGKSLAVAAATISTYQAGATALASVPYPLNLFALATTIATGFLAVREILKVNVPGASASGATVADTSIPLPNVPELQTPIQETHNNLSGYDEDFFNQSMQPVLVLEDLNTAQRRLTVAEVETTF